MVEIEATLANVDQNLTYSSAILECTLFRIPWLANLKENLSLLCHAIVAPLWGHKAVNIYVEQQKLTGHLVLRLGKRQIYFQFRLQNVGNLYI